LVRPLLLATGAGALLAAFGWSVGLPAQQGAVIGLCVVAAVAVRVVLAAPGRDGREDAWREHWVRIPGGVRRDVRQLSWRIRTDRRGVHREALWRLRAVAAQRLTANGLDPAAPADAAAIRALLGETAHAVVADDTDRPIGYGAYVQTLRALERLDPATPGTPPPPSSSAPTSPRPSTPEHR
jgi:hypothetical protein